MAKTAYDLIQIMRKATGRMDSSDPLFTDEIMLGYINDFLTLEKSLDLRLKEKRTWWEFVISPTTPNPLPVDLQAPFGAPAGTQFTTIGSFCTADGFEVFWYEDPAQFYAIWPETQPYQPQRPTYVLYYNNELTWRGPPDKEYAIKINAYQIDLPLAANDSLQADYIWRYVAYGAARDLLNDYREFELVAQNQAAFNDYRSKVYARTYQQQMTQRSTPRF
jgi:hypothetical protein